MRYSSATMEVLRSPHNKREWKWFVYQPTGDRPLARGVSDSYDGAFRSARNWIKRNQNAIYGDVRAHLVAA